MGCCSSGIENQVKSFVEIPLLQTARNTENINSAPYYTMEPPPKKPSYEGNIIEHSALSVIKDAPEIEESRKQTFKECFSHIDVNTFQNVPFMSVQSHLSVPQFDALQSQSQSHKFEEYSQFLDQAMSSILTPLHEMKVQDETDLTLLLDQ